MINLKALQKVLPISGLEPQWVASIDVFSDKPRNNWWQEKITFLEPPTGQHIPYVDARSVMALLFKHQGMPAEDAKAKADAEWSELKEQLDSTQRVVFYDYLEKNPGEHIPVPALLLHLRRRKLVSDHIADFLDQAVATVVSTPMFAGPDNRDGLHLRTAGFLLIKKKKTPPPRTSREAQGGQFYAITSAHLICRPCFRCARP